MLKIDSLSNLCLHEIADLMSAEKQIAKAMPDVIKAASATGLQIALKKHLEQTAVHQERLKEVATMLGNPSLKMKHCKGMEGLLVEAAEFIEQAEGEPGIIDAGIIASCQRIELYEVAGYGTLCSFLELVGETKAATPMLKTLSEEKAASNTLLDLIGGVVSDHIETEMVGSGRVNNRSRVEDDQRVSMKAGRAAK